MKVKFHLLKFVLVAITFLIATTETNSQPSFNFFSMKEGVVVASQPNSELIFAASGWYAISDKPDVDPNEEFPLGVIFEGEDIGKATTWMFLFRRKNDAHIYGYCFWKPNVIEGYLWITGTSYDFSTAPSLDDFEIIDSDVFVTKLMQSSEYLNNKNSLSDSASPEEIMVGGSSSFLKDRYNFEKEGVYWLSSIYDVASQKRYNCYMPYSADGEISCEIIDLSSINSDDFIQIEIFPNPAEEEIYWTISDDVILSSIELFDIEGKLISNYNPSITNIEVSELHSGKYFLCFTVNNKKKYVPLIIEK